MAVEPFAPRPRAALRGPAGQAVLLTLAGFFANALSYVLLLAAAAVLAPRGYGQLVAVHGLLLVATVPALAVQTVVARRTAVGDTDGLRAAAGRVAVAATLLTLLAVVPVQHFARLPSAWPLLAVAAAVPALVALGVAQGVAQGRRRFVTLARIGAASAVARSGAGMIGLLVGRTALWSLVATTAGYTALALVVAARTRLPAGARRAPAAAPAREAAHATHAHGVLYGLTALDLLLARHVLPPGQAAVYAAGAVLARAALWLPQSVATLTFPALTDPARRRTVLPRAVAVVAGAGTILTLGVLVLSGPAARIVGSGHYPQLSHAAWAFALLGTGAAVLQLAVVAGLATRSLTPVALAWAAAVAETVVVLSLGRSASVLAVAGSCAAAVGVAAVTAVLVQLRAAPDADPRLPARPPRASDGQAAEQRSGYGAEHGHHRT